MLCGILWLSRSLSLPCYPLRPIVIHAAEMQATKVLHDLQSDVPKCNFRQWRFYAGVRERWHRPTVLSQPSRFGGDIDPP